MKSIKETVSKLVSVKETAELELSQKRLNKFNKLVENLRQEIIDAGITESFEEQETWAGQVYFHAKGIPYNWDEVIPKLNLIFKKRGFNRKKTTHAKERGTHYTTIVWRSDLYDLQAEIQFVNDYNTFDLTVIDGVQ